MKKIAINIGLTVFATLASLLLLEFALRIFCPIYSPHSPQKHKCENFVEYSSSYGWFHKRGFVTWVENQEYATKIIINQKGLRGAEYRYEKEPGTLRVVMLGDSFAFGLGVDESDTVAVKLEELFGKAGKKVEVINMGVDGFGTDQEYLLLREEGVKYDPDVVICLFFVGNDVENNSSGEQYHELKPYFTFDGDSLNLKNYPVPVKKGSMATPEKASEPRGKIRMPLKSFFQDHSYAYTFLRLRYNYLLYKIGVRKSVHLSVNKEALRVTDEIFLKMKQLCDEYDIELIIAAIPTKEQVLGAEKDDIQRPFAKFVRRSGIQYIDLLGPLKGRRDLNYTIDSHWNKKGSAVIARILYDAINAK